MRKKHGSTTSNSISLIVGLLVGALIFWAGHKFWPEPVSSLKPDNKQADTTKRFTGVLGESTIADIATEAEKSVVNIDTSTNVIITETPVFSPFGLFLRPREMQRKGAGSGFIIRSDGYILTNNHVIEGFQNIRVTLHNQKSYPGKVVGRDKLTDLALVKIKAKNLPVAKLGSSDNLRPGDWVIAIGSPLGLQQSVTLGIVSALGRSLESKISRTVRLIQTDAAINPGNSGGPLLNIHGEVIGINMAIRGDAQNIGFAIPVSLAKNIAKELIETGKVAHPYLGIYMQNLEPEIANQLGINPNLKGPLVVRLARNGPAARSGLKPADVIVELEGKPITSSKDVQNCISQHKPGDVVESVVIRSGKRVPIRIQIGDMPTRR